MPLSAKSLERSGRISSRQMSKLPALKGTRSEPSKMAPFDSKRKGEGALHNKGVLKPHEIDHPERQDRGGTWGTKGRGPPTKGARAGAEGSPIPRKQIDDAHQRPKFPKGGSKASKSHPLTGNTKMKGGRIQRAGNVYDTPGRN